MIEYGDGVYRHGWAMSNIEWCQGRIVVTARHGRVRSFDPDTGATLPVELAAQHAEAHPAFSLDGQHMAAADGDTVRVGSLDFHVDVESVSCLAWSPDGTRLAVGTDLGKSGRVWIFPLDGSAAVELKGARGAIEDIKWKPDGTQLAARTMTTAYHWAAAGGKALTLFKGKKFVGLAGWHGDLAVVVDGRVSVCAIDPSDASVRWSLPGGGPAAANDEVVCSVRFHEIDVIVQGAVVRCAQIPLASPDLALDPSGGRVALSGPRVLVFEIDHLDSIHVPPGWGHGSMINSVDEHADFFATVARDNAVCLWKRGQREVVARIDTDRLTPTEAVAIAQDAIWVGTGQRVRRFDWSGANPVSSPEFAKNITLLRHVGDAVVAVTQAHRSSKGQVIVLEPDTLQVRFAADTGEKFDRSVTVDDDRLRLISGQVYADLDLSGALGDVVPAMSLGVAAGEGSLFPGFRLRHIPASNKVEVLELDEQTAARDYDVIDSDSSLYLGDDGAVLVVPGADRLAFFAPATGQALGFYPVDRQVTYIYEFADGGVLVGSLDGGLAELPLIKDMIAAAHK